jgi:hypothetical protein
MAGTYGLTTPPTPQTGPAVYTPVQYAEAAGITPAIANQTLGQLQQVTEQKAKAPNGGGTLFGLHLPQLGIGKLVGSLTGSLTGIENVADQALHGHLAPAAEMGKGILSSFAGTAINVLDPYGPSTQGLRSDVGNLLGGQQYTPQSFGQQYEHSGLLTPIVQNVGNIAGAAGGVEGLLGDAGGTAAMAAGRAADAGYSADEMSTAAQAAHDLANGDKAAFSKANITDSVLQTAGQAIAKAEDKGVDWTSEASQAKGALLNKIDMVAHPYSSLIDQIIRPLGRAASASLEGTTTAANEADAAAEAAQTATPGGVAAEAPVVPQEPPTPSVAQPTGAVGPGNGGLKEALERAVSENLGHGPQPNGLKDALEGSAEAAQNGDPQDIAAAAKTVAAASELHRLALEGATPGTAVDLYHGEQAGSPTVGPQWSKSLTEAQGHAGEGGTVYHTRVSPEIYQAGHEAAVAAGDRGIADEVAHLPNELTTDDKIERTDIPGKEPVNIDVHPGEEIKDALIRHDDEVTPPEGLKDVAEALQRPQAHTDEQPNTLGLTRSPKGPMQDALEHAAHAPIKQWAADAVSHLPDPVVRALSHTDRFLTQARGVGQVLRERLRMQDINRREIKNSDAFAAPKAAAAKYLVGREIRMPDGTTKVVTAKMADGLMGDELMAHLEHVSAVEDAVARHATPTAIEDMRKTLVRAGERSELRIPDEWLNNTNGSRTELGTIIDNSISGLRDAAEERTNILRETSGKGLDHISQNFPDLSPKSQKIMASVAQRLRVVERMENSTIPRVRLEAAAEMAAMRDELAKISVELDAVHAADKAARERLSAERLPVEASEEQLKGETPGSAKAIGAQQKNLPVEARGALGPKAPLAVPKTGPQVVRQALDVTGSKYELEQRAVNSAYAVRDSEQAAAKAAELGARKIAIQKSLDKLKQSFEQHTLPAELMRNKLGAGIDRSIDSVGRELANPAMAQVSAHFKPIWDSIKSLHQEALHNPELAKALVDGHIQEGWDTVLRIAAQQGFDPVHVRSFTDSEVQHLVYSSVSLGKQGRDLGKTEVAGTRNARIQAATRTRSLSALQAGIVEATHEMHTNALAKFLEDTYAKPYNEGDRFLPGHQAWDPERQYLLAGTRNALGDVVARGLGHPTMQIPSAIVHVLKQYEKAAPDSMVLRGLQNVTQPWKMLTLSFHPTFFVNHILGHVILAAKTGVSLRDWSDAFESFRNGEIDPGRNILMQSLGAGDRSFEGKAGAVAGGLRGEIGTERSAIPAARGIEGIKQAIAEAAGPGKVKVALRGVTNMISAPAAAIDDIGRVAVYLHSVRTGDDVITALEKSQKALIDFNDMSPFERNIVKSVVPFYTFQKGILKIMASIGYDHPLAASIGLVLGQVNQEMMANEYGNGTQLPSAYAGLLQVPGLGLVNPKFLNPFSDAASLVTPQGIVNAVNPFLNILLRNAYQAPTSSKDNFPTVGPYGTEQQGTSPAHDLQQLLAGIPAVSLATAKGGIQSALEKFVLPAQTPASQVRQALARENQPATVHPRYGTLAYHELHPRQGGSRGRKSSYGTKLKMALGKAKKLSTGKGGVKGGLRMKGGGKLTMHQHLAGHGSGAAPRGGVKGLHPKGEHSQAVLKETLIKAPKGHGTKTHGVKSALAAFKPTVEKPPKPSKILVGAGKGFDKSKLL